MVRLPVAVDQVMCVFDLIGVGEAERAVDADDNTCVPGGHEGGALGRWDEGNGELGFARGGVDAEADIVLAAGGDGGGEGLRRD